MKYVRLAPWNSYETVGFDTPKGHAVLHFLPFVFLFGAVDNARLDNFEHDHRGFGSRVQFDELKCGMLQ